MSEQNPGDQSFAKDTLSELIRDEWIRVNAVVTKQWRMAMITICMCFVAILTITCVAFSKTERQPKELVMNLIESQKALRQAVNTAEGGGGNAGDAKRSISTSINKLVGTQQEALSKLADIEAKPSASSQSIVQLVGSAAVITLLGLLGLQRLQNFDSEIASLRNSVDTRVEVRAKELRDQVETARSEILQIQTKLESDLHQGSNDIRTDLERAISTSIDNALRESEGKIQLMFTTAKNETEEFFAMSHEAADKRAKEIQDEVKKAEAVAEQIDQLIAAYPWLGKKGASEVLEKIQELASVDEAHQLASILDRQKDRESARAALRAIVERKLTGTSDDFHNSCSQAMRMEEPNLAIELAEIGLGAFPNQVDLVANKMLGLHNLGKSKDARAYFDEWRIENPTEASKAWRAIMFYGSILRGSALTEEEVQRASEVLKEATASMPCKPKVWGARIDFEIRNNRFEEAELVTRAAVQSNPFSQQLHMQWGEILMTLGRPQEARDALTNAIKTDFQDQFQHDVRQAAVFGTLAQAYEACGEPEKAVSIYTSIVNAGDDENSFFIANYAKNRLQALSLLGIEGADEAAKKVSETDPAQLGALLNLLSRKGGPEIGA